MNIRAVADLGGLGAREGPAVNYFWTLPSVWLSLLPWLPLLALLLLVKQNRCARAWLILAPLIAVLALNAGTGAADLLPSGAVELFSEAIAALAFGLAAVWLLAPVLARQHRLLTFLCFVPAFAIASGLTAVLRQSWGDELPFMLLQAAVFIACGLGAMSLALFLAGCVCRRRYSPVKFTFWFLVLLAALWLAVATPFALIATFASEGSVPWGVFLGGVSLVVSISFGIVLPFLLLSYASGFHRERLQQLFPMGDLLSPTLPVPPPALAAQLPNSL